MLERTTGWWGRPDAARLAAGLGALAVLLTACGSVGVRDSGQASAPTSSAPAGTPTPSADSTTPSDTGSGSGSGDGGTSQGACYLGKHAVRTITGREGVGTPLGDAKPSGSGGSLVLEFTADGRWVLSSDGSRPVVFDIGGIRANVAVNGRSTGTYRKVGDQFAFELGGSSGTAEISTAAGNTDVPMSSVARALAPSGTATITCGSGQIRFVSDTVEMTLAGSTGSGSSGSGSGSSGGSAAEAPAVISQPGLSGTFDCRGHAVEIRSASTRLHLVGRCPTLEITGALNQVTIDTVGSITVTGAGDKVIWHAGLNGGRPSVDVTGYGSTATQG